MEYESWWCLSALKYEFGEYVSDKVLDKLKIFMESSGYVMVKYNRVMKNAYRILREVGYNDIPFRSGYYSLVHYKKWRKEENE